MNNSFLFNSGIWSRTVFGLFETVINNNRACRALSGDIGTCLSYPECFAFRGNISGTCGRGYGLCCVSKSIDFKKCHLSFIDYLFSFLATKTCQGVIYANNTYFVNQGYPGSYTSAGQCYTTVNRLAPNICQLRYMINISWPIVSYKNSFLLYMIIPVICFQGWILRHFRLPNRNQLNTVAYLIVLW